MFKSLPHVRRSAMMLFLIITLVLPSGIFAQQENLKTESSQTPSNQQITAGHNNLRKLSRMNDQQAGARENKQNVADDAQLRRLYELELLKDPATGEIPEGIR